MIQGYFSWEDQLIQLALNALDPSQLDNGSHSYSTPFLDSAYRHCDEITQTNSRTFFMASALLPAPKRRAIRALYAFCRVSDDIVDLGDEQASQRLAEWESQTLHPYLSNPEGPVSSNSLVALAWQDARRRFGVPHLYARQLIDGVACDLGPVRCATFSDLASYSYGVAGTVGLMSMHITGHSGPEAIPHAIRLCVALQLTNILRDVGEDWARGRLYLPQDELEQFGLTEADIAAGAVTGKWRAFMRFQIERVRQLYAAALPGICHLNPDSRFAIAAAGELYQAILTEIEKADYNVFSQRASVSALGKLRRLPGIWWRARTLSYSTKGDSPTLPSPCA
jgi:15-cis-phytoene synthase